MYVWLRLLFPDSLEWHFYGGHYIDGAFPLWVYGLSVYIDIVLGLITDPLYIKVDLHEKYKHM